MIVFALLTVHNQPFDRSIDGYGLNTTHAADRPSGGASKAGLNYGDFNYYLSVRYFTMDANVYHFKQGMRILEAQKKAWSLISAGTAPKLTKEEFNRQSKA